MPRLLRLVVGAVIAFAMGRALPADDLSVFAAASLTNALEKIAANYAKESPDKLAFNFAASGTLAVQIRNGAPADLFFSADELKMNDLAKDGLLLAGSRRDVLGNTLAIIVPVDSPLKIKSPRELADASVTKIALGQPKLVPAGTYSEQYLRKLGLWDKIQSRVIPQESVRAALAAVETGNVDAGIVYKTDALQSKKVRIAYDVRAAEGPAIVYPAAVVRDSRHAVAAQKFLAYLTSPPALAVFERNGFVLHPAK